MTLEEVYHGQLAFLRKGTSDRIYVRTDLLEAYQAVSEVLGAPLSRLLGAGLLVEEGTKKLDELRKISVEASKLFRPLWESQFQPVATDVMHALIGSEIDSFTNEQTKRARVFLPENYHPSNGSFEITYRLSNSLIHSTTAKNLGYDLLASDIKSGLDALLDKELKIKRAWIGAIKNALTL